MQQNSQITLTAFLNFLLKKPSPKCSIMQNINQFLYVISQTTKKKFIKTVSFYMLFIEKEMHHKALSIAPQYTSHSIKPTIYPKIPNNFIHW